MKFSLTKKLSAIVISLGLLVCVSLPVVGQVSPGQVVKDCDICPELVVISAGSFLMGSNERDQEKPIHPVKIKSFLLGKTEVTQGQWKAVMGSNPSFFKDCGDNCPVERISWDDSQVFIKKLNAKSGKQYRLPSEAEWEYAARAGNTGKWSFGDDERQLPSHDWFEKNSAGKTQAVGQKIPNAFGLLDMNGNVSEWVADCWHDNYSGAPIDGSAWTTGCKIDLRVPRGGSIFNEPATMQSASRFMSFPELNVKSIGLRIARSLLTP